MSVKEYGRKAIEKNGGACNPCRYGKVVPVLPNKGSVFPGSLRAENIAVRVDCDLSLESGLIKTCKKSSYKQCGTYRQAAQRIKHLEELESRERRRSHFRDLAKLNVKVVID